METLRPNTQRAKYAMIMIAVVMALNVISIFSDYLQYDFVQKVLSDSYVSMSEADANDDRQQLVSILELIAMIISAITFIQWFRRAYYNLGILRNDLKHTNGWAAGAWFIPIVCIFLPYQIMKELYTKTNECLANNEKHSKKLSRAALPWWWTFWILGSFVSNLAGKFILKADTAQGIEDGTVLSMFSSGLMLIAGVLVLMVINNYSNVEHLLQELEQPIQEEKEEELL